MSQYIGKTISLVSNSDIKYVGTLHEINSEQSTVSLKNVRSYGTEGRRGGNNEIPASDSVYEFIVFRGSDVKDLKIAETAPPPVQTFTDPAIVQSNSYAQAGSYPGYGNYQQQQQQPAPAPAPAAIGSASAEPKQKEPESKVEKEPKGRGQTQPPTQQAQVQPQQVQPQPTQQQPTQPVQQPQQQQPPAPQQQPPSARPRPVKPNVPDFNFDESNAKFSKETAAKEESVIPKGSGEEFYDRKSSFFDNISSTTKERLEGTNDNKTAYQRRGEERQLNLETFGQAEAHHHNNWRGGRGGQRGRGRGGYRGRGGNNNTNNNNNNNWRNRRGGYNNNNPNNELSTTQP